jgi:hypothetical protein
MRSLGLAFINSCLNASTATRFKERASWVKNIALMHCQAAKYRPSMAIDGIKLQNRRLSKRVTLDITPRNRRRSNNAIFLSLDDFLSIEDEEF